MLANAPSSIIDGIRSSVPRYASPPVARKFRLTVWRGMKVTGGRGGKCAVVAGSEGPEKGLLNRIYG